MSRIDHDFDLITAYANPVPINPVRAVFQTAHAFVVNHNPQMAFIDGATGQVSVQRNRRPGGNDFANNGGAAPFPKMVAPAVPAQGSNPGVSSGGGGSPNPTGWQNAGIRMHSGQGVRAPLDAAHAGGSAAGLIHDVPDFGDPLADARAGIGVVVRNTVSTLTSAAAGVTGAGSSTNSPSTGFDDGSGSSGSGSGSGSSGSGSSSPVPSAYPSPSLGSGYDGGLTTTPSTGAN